MAIDANGYQASPPLTEAVTTISDQRVSDTKPKNIPSECKNINSGRIWNNYDGFGDKFHRFAVEETVGGLVPSEERQGLPDTEL